jgi:hypothetical protein
MGKKLVRPNSAGKKKKKLGMVADTQHPSYAGGISRRITVQASLGKITRHYFKNN